MVEDRRSGRTASTGGLARRAGAAALLLGLAAAPACSLITGPDLQVTIEELSVTIAERPQFAEISGEGGDIVVEGVTMKTVWT